MTSIDPPAHNSDKGYVEGCMAIQSDTEVRTQAIQTGTYRGEHGGYRLYCSETRGIEIRISQMWKYVLATKTMTNNVSF